MKIIQYVGSLGDGGAETLVKNYCLLLKEDGHTPVVVTNYPPKQTANSKQLREAGIQIIPIFEHFNLINRIIYRFFKKSFFAKKLLKVIERVDPIAIHIHMCGLENIASVSKNLRKVNLLYTCHSLPEVFLGKDKHPKEYAAANKLLKRNNLQLISLHEDMRKEMNAMFQVEDTITLNNGIDFSLYKPLNEDEEQRLRLETGIKHDEFVMGHVGRFTAVKNHTFILKVFKELLNVHPKSKLLLIGTGPLENEIKQQAENIGILDNIVILKERTDVSRLLRLMDVFVFPSHYEGLSIALVEAQVAGLKCLVSDTVNQAAILNLNAIPLSLKQSAKEWCEAIFDNNLQNPYPGDITQFNLRVIIKQVEQLYNRK